jgi:hypothetical protein
MLQLLLRQFTCKRKETREVLEIVVFKFEISTRRWSDTLLLGIEMQMLFYQGLAEGEEGRDVLLGCVLDLAEEVLTLQGQLQQIYFVLVILY